MTASFTLDGPTFTRIARDLFLDERPGKAWRFIVDSLTGGAPGAAEHLASRLLGGTQKLVGDSTTGLGVEDDDDPEYAARARQLYAGRVRIEGAWFRPRTEVTDGGPDDAYYANKHANMIDHVGHGAGREWARRRVQFYARNGERAVWVRSGPGYRHRPHWPEDIILFEPCSDPPHWWPEATTPTEALEAFLKAGCTLDQDGWYRRFGAAAKAEAEATKARPVTPPDPAASLARQAQREAEERVEEERRRTAFEAMVASTKERVLAQAAGDLIDLTDEAGAVVVSVPRAPFLNWALHRTSLRHLAPPWTLVADSGLKMANDDPYHTDWWVGAGLPMDRHSIYEGPVHDAAWHTLGKVQHDLGSFACGVIVGTPETPIEGTVGAEVAVLPDLHPDRLPLLAQARAVITETGGQLAHLAQIALERNLPILRVPDACTRLPVGTRLTLFPAEGRIVIHVVTREVP